MQNLTRNILPAMAFLRSSLGGFARICDGEFNLSSTCIQRTIVDVLNLLFALAFYICLVFGSIRKNRTTGQSGRDWITQCLSICCGLTSIAYFGAGLNNLIATNHGFRHLRWSVYFIRGLIWMTLTVSLHAQRSQIIKLLVSAWWVLFFLMASALNIETLVIAVNIHISEVILWLLSFLIFFCALRNLWHFISACGPNTGLSEPLLFDKADENPSKLGTAGIFSRLSFSWINPLLSLGHSKPLVLEDIPCLVSEDEASLANEKFNNVWQKLKSSNSRSNLVLWALVRVHLKEMITLGTCAFLRTLSVVVAPLLLYAFINYANSDVKTTGNGLLLVGCLVVVKVVESVSYRHFFFNSRRTGMKMRSALMVAVYQKQLKLSSLGRRRHSTGEVVNYIAIDAYRMGEFPMWFNVGWTSLVQIFLVIGVLFGVVGLGALPGLAPLAIFGLLNVPFARLLQKCQSEFMIAQDKRLRATSEILNSMKIIKLQAWEENFKRVIESYRDCEFKWLSEAQHKKVFGTVLYWMSPTIVSSVIFAGCALFRSAPLDASTIFTILAALRSMAEPVRMLPEALSTLIQAKVSFDRIDSFLLDDELQSSRTNKTQFLDLKDGVCIRNNNGYFSWDPESAIPTLRNVCLQIKVGQKIAVCGPVGAGKSSLLYALIGEIPNVSGAVEVIGSIAYVSQTAWIQSGTIRDNILFGKPMDKTKYEKTIKACALDKDIKSFPHGDLTEIGQRGLNMSGGQRQRIQIARAVYNDADIYLLDDPFSAVDAHTAAILFSECVMGALESKTVILVTHQVEFLSEVDMILVVEAGQITQSGSYEELLTAGTAFEQLVNAHKSSITDLDSSAAGSRMEPQEGMSLNQLEETGEVCFGKNNSEGEISTKPLPGVQLTEEEEKEIGNVGWKPFYDYILISKGLLFLGLNVLTQSGFVSLQAVSGYWLAFAIQIPNISSTVLIGVYAAISATSAVFVHLRSLYAALLGLRASKSFFTGLTISIFNAPMLFFDSTPVGRILTRYSSDLSVLDYDIPFSYAYSLAALVELLGTIVVMASVTWPVLIVAALAFLASNYVQSYYQASARELMRINGTTKAPVMSYAAETSLGVATIRAFNMAERFFQNNLRLVDTDAKLFLYSSAAMEWLILRIEALQNLTLFTAAFLLVLLPKGFVPPGLMGLSLSYALALTGTQVFMSRWYSSLCNYIISVERIKQFMQIPPEPPAIVENNRPPLSWPTMGRIELHDLKIKYRPNAPLVLKGITCTFIEGTRVGVVGRTGSGKTTLISALFRLVEPYSGKILVDGLDICSIGLKDLRMKLSIIPQEPTLFRGSIRTNLDPLGIYSDDEIWKALEKCQLRETISKLPNLLDSSVSDEGENWSAGQRQLFCLGRVLLKRNRILVLDEATASIDSITDAILQKVIREEFSNCTVITVAHRVPTVIDSDMVMVLSFGTLAEYDEPTKLMQTNSSFAKLVAEYWSSRRNSVQGLDAYHI